MRITVTFVGILAELIHEGSFEVRLSEGATYGDLLQEIKREFGHVIPDLFWDPKVNAFKDPVFAVANGRALESPDTSLRDTDEVRFLTLVAGG